MKRLMYVAGVALVASAAWAEAAFTSPDIFKVTSGEAKVRIAPETASAAEVPADLPPPIFHFDAADVARWKFGAGGTEVTNIPSSVGSRYLASTLDGGPSAFIGNGASKAPLYIESVPELGGRPALDFGDAKNTERALWFNPVVPEGAAADCVASNVLFGIGSVVAVHKVLHDSVNAFLGGGWVKGSPADAADTAGLGDNWKRNLAAAEGETGAYWTPMAVGYRGPLAAAKAWHNGQVTGAAEAGFAPGWDVTVFQPTSAVFQAAGVGLSAVPSHTYDRGGGQWAELYVFGEVVDEDALMRLQAHLRAKWLGAQTVGYGGAATVGCLRTRRDAHTRYGVTNEIETAAGETLQVDRLSGGRGFAAATVKRGAGTLRILDAAHYGGDLVLAGGRLDLTKRVTPGAADDLPGDLAFRFDASEAGSLTSNTDDDYVLRWRNLTDFTVKGATVYAQARGGADAARPWILRNALNGRSVLDFGSYTTAKMSKDGRAMEFVHSADGTTFTAFSPASVYTVVAVVGAQRSGGNLVGNFNKGMFARHQDWVDWLTDADFDRPLLRTAPVGDPGYASIYPTTNALVMLDGVKVDSQAGYATPGYQVVAIRAAGSAIRYIGGTSVRQGGLRLGELLVWKRPLSETEVRDAEAYLTKKWFGRELPGYQAADVTVPDVRTVTVAAASEIYVPSGTVARIDGLVANAEVRKTGGGTLVVGPFGADGAGAIRVIEGAVVGGAAGDVADKVTPAIGASLHLDASDAASIQFADGSDRAVWYWYDREHRNVAYNMTAARQPFLNTVELQNGLPVMDFSTTGADGRTLTLAKALDGVRSAFVVWYPLHGGTVLGSSSKRESNDYSIDYARASDGDGLVIYNEGAQPVRRGEVRINGQAISEAALSTSAANGKFQLFEFHPAAATSVSALAADRDANLGGGRYGEILLYERALTAREKTATRNYLLKKWFGKADDELEGLPSAPAVRIPGSLAFADGATWNITVDADGQAAAMSVTGTISFGADLTVNFDGLPTDGSLRDLKLTVAAADAFSNLEALETATFTGHAFDKDSRPRFFARAGGRLIVRFGRHGTALILR